MLLLDRIIASRRRFLAMSLAAGLLLKARSVFGATMAPSRVRRDPLKSLPAFLDTLLPADESPSASELGVHRHIIAAARSSRSRHLLRAGCAWLDREARQRGAADFASIDQSARDAIVARAAAAPRRSLPRIFFDAVRANAFKLYYADARSWVGLGYEGPPQPAGFPDHAAPPRPIR